MDRTRSAFGQNTARSIVGPRAWLPRDLPLALAGALVALSIFWVQGFPRMAEPGIDNDSVLRLVQVRDLLAGQGWFDLHQYRMGAEGGFIMHWSRLVDAPIAALILLFRPLLGNAGAEFAAAIVWPITLMVLWLLALLRAARSFGGDEARLPALVLGTAALHFQGTFSPGSFDHHNLQLTLITAMAACLIDGRSMRSGLMAGAAAAASIAIGMETIPYVAAAGVSVALLFWLSGERQAPVAAGFGLGFAGMAALSLALTIPSAAWFSTTCDAFSGAHAGSAIIGGFGLAIATALVGKRSGFLRLTALAALAAASVAFVLLVYPQCLAEPYGDVAPRLREYWLSGISEAQSLRGLIASEPEGVALYYATPLIAVAALCWQTFRTGFRDEALPVGLLLVTAIAVSAWQVRAAIFSLALAVIPLSAWVGTMRGRAASVPSTASTLKMTAAWLVSLNIVWGLAGLLAFERVAGEKPVGKTAKCHAAEDFAELARLPAGNVLAASNHGPAILAFSSHRALSGLYHRNEEGGIAMLDVLLGTTDEALETMRKYNVAYLAVCPGNPETRVLSKRAPDGLLAGLVAGNVPDWMGIVPETAGKPLKLYRIGPFTD